MATYKTGWMKKLINGVSTKIFAISHVKAVYYDYAHSKTLKSKLDDMDTSISEKADKEKYGDTIVSVGRKPDSTVGDNSFAFGPDTTASGYASHAEGAWTTASGDYSHVEGCSTSTLPNDISSSSTNEEIISKWKNARIKFSWAKGESSHVEGHNNLAFEACSHAEGTWSIASGVHSHAEGILTTASGRNSHAEGYGTTALDNQHAQGHFNNTTTATDNSEIGTSTGTAFVIGNGTNSSLSNAFRVTGNGETIAKMAYSTTGADYAEYFEWVDGNPDSQDRRGYFVTLDGNKIKLADSTDYVLGVVSAMPSVIGNFDEEWMGRYILDDFGAFIEEEFEYESTKIDEETGEEITVKETGIKWKENPDYDSKKEYVPRAKRKEWNAVGMLGVISVIDDGSCQVNGFCKVADGGTATASDTGYRVVKRVTDNIVKIVFR